MKRWLSRHWHELCASWWETQIESARRQEDWLYLDHAITRRNYHDRMLMQEQIGKKG